MLYSVSVFGQNAYGPDFLNLHCTIPDPLAQTLFNIQPRPGLVPDRAANGNVIIYCDAPSGTFKASFNGGAYASLANSALPTGAVGSVLASQGVGIQTIFQTKPMIDARDIGVDCTYTNDSAAALNAITDNENGFGGQLTGATLLFPPGCHVKLTSSNWKVVNQSAFTITGAARGTASGAGIATTISYCASLATVPAIDMESTFGGEVANLIVETKGTGCATGTNVGITVDKANAHSNVNSTDNFIHDVSITTNLAGGAGPSGWIGLSISPVSASNVEDTRLWNSRINCQSTANNSVGVNLNASFNAKLEEFKHNQILSCASGYTQSNGDWVIEGSDLALNGADINVGTGSDPGLITKIVSESNQMIGPGAAGNWPTTIMASHIGWNGSGSAGLCGIDLGSFGAGSGTYVMIGNGADPPPSTAVPWCASVNQSVTEVSDQWSGWSVPLNTFQAGKDIGSSYGSIGGGAFRATNAAHVSSNTSQNVGFGFISHNGVDLLGLGFNANSNQECVGGGRPCVGTDAIFLGNQNIVLSGVWPISQAIIGCTYTGTAGSTHWTVAILPIDAAGKRAGVYPFNGNSGCFNAASTLSVSNFLTVTWPRIAGAANYAVILMNPASPIGQGELSSTVADAGGAGLTQSTTITSGSTGDTFNYAFPNYQEAAVTSISGESLTVNATTSITVGGSANKVVCWKADAKTLGFCSTVVDSTGACTCN